MSKGFKQLKLEDRKLIESLIKLKHSHREIAFSMTRENSSISREIKDNSVNGEYNAEKADQKAYVRRYHAKFQQTKIKKNSKIEEYVIEKLKDDWSPDQISGRIKIEYKKGEIDFSVRKDAIYSWLYSCWGQSYCKYLKSHQSNRKRRKQTQTTKKELIKNRVSIHERPSIIKTMTEFGHWEADTLGRSKYTSPETGVGIVETKTKYLMFKKVNQLRDSMKQGFKKLINQINPKYVSSITYDNGVENQKYETLNIDSYFCDPYSPWQKPIIEGSFGLLRKFIHKKSDLKDFSEIIIHDIIQKMNNTPRKCLNYRTPQECFNEEVEKLKQKLNKKNNT